MNRGERGPSISEEPRDVVVTWNQTRTDYPRDRTLAQLFEAQVDRAPHAIAVIDGETRLTYETIERRSNQLAGRLRGLGVGPGTLVGLCVERSAEMIIGLLGVLKAGGAYVPLDPSYPRARLTMMLEDASPAVLLTYGDVAANLPPHAAAVVRLETQLPDAARQPAPSTADDAAYVIYTSGTTGRPKGVIAPHRAVARLVLNTNYVRIRASDVFLALSPLSFDAATFEIWGALLNGARIVVHREARLDPREVTVTIQREGVSILWLTAALFDEFSLHHLAGLRGLRYLLAGGDVLPVSAIQRALRELPDTTLINGYGPTETTTFATAFRFPRTWSGSSAPIGRPISNTQTYILDETQRPVPVGVAGELYIGGDGLANGYLHLPELTAEKFIDHPFGEAGRRLYRTGDQARWLADGTIEFLGRRDHQVKLRGFRIELEEVENALTSDSQVAQAVALIREAAPGDKRLVAYCVPISTGAIDVTSLKQRLAEQLPEYMIPSHIVPIARLPVTPNGKVDRAMLPPVPWKHTGTGQVEPRTTMEIRLAALWGELLNTQPIGRDDDFFALGGHSLLVGRLAARIRSELGIETSLAALYGAPTLATMAADLEHIRDQPETDRDVPPAPPPLVVKRSTGPAPLSIPQERVWFFERVVPGNLAYQMQATLDFRGPLDVALLAAALTELVRRHEILRTAFKEVDGIPVQEVQAPYQVELRVVDLPGGSFEEFRAQADEIIAVETAKPFQLGSGRLARWILFRYSPQRYLLLHAEHHLVHDGWSLAIFLDELTALYAAFRGGAPASLPPPPLQFADFARWQRRWLTQDTLAAFLEHWKRRLTPLPPPLNLPTDRPHPPVFSFRGHVLREDFSSAEYARLRGAAKLHNVTLFTVMFSGFAALLARRAQQEAVVIGVGVANRRLAEAERVLGMMINTLPLRVDLRGDPTFDQLLAQVHRSAIDAYAWQDVPLDRLVETLALPRDPSRNPLFSVMFSFHDAAIPDLTFADIEGKLRIEHNGSAKTDINVIVIPRAEQRVGRAASQENDSLSIIWEYATDLFDEATMWQMLEDYHDVLAAGIEEPQRPVSQLGIARAARWPRALPSIGDRTPSGSSMFAAQVREAPDRIAVRHGATALTYAELDRAARELPDRIAGADASHGFSSTIAVPRGLAAVLAAVAAWQHGSSPRSEETGSSSALSDIAAALICEALRAARFTGIGDTLLQLAPPDSELFSIEIWSALLSGATLQLTDVGDGDGDRTGAIAAALIQHAAPAARLSVVLTDACASALAARHTASLRGVHNILVMGAQPATERLRPCGEARLLHGAGIPEVPLVLLGEHGAPPATTTGLAKNGLTGELRPIAGVDVVICDHAGTEVPVGAIGAMRIFFAGRATELTSRWRARRLVDGAVQLRGQAHELGTVNGFATDLYETRSVLAACPDVVEFALTLQRGQIAAYVVPRSMEALRAFVASRLPAYQTPSRYISLDALPLDRMGQIDPAALPPAALTQVVSDETLSPTQARLAALCAELLKSDSIDIRANFFLLGGHSLLAIRLIALVNHEFEIDLSVARFLREPTILDLATAVDEAKPSPTRVARPRSARRDAATLLAERIGGQSASAAPALTRRDATGDCPLSFDQEELWDVEQQAPGKPLYNVTAAISLRGELNIPALERSLNELACRHDTLRTSFHRDEKGRAVMRIAPEVRLALALVDLRDQPEVERANEAKALCLQFGSQPFELSKAPLIRTMLLRLDETMHQLVVTMHHIITDGWSNLVFLRELFTLYTALVSGQAPEDALPTLPIQYSDYVRWQREWLQGEYLESLLAWWKHQLAGAPATLDLPIDRPRPAIRTYNGAKLYLRFKPELLERLRALSEQEGVTLYMTLLAAFQVLLARWTGQEDMVIGSPVVNRHRVETESLIGYLISVLLIRGDLRGQPTFREVLRRTRDTVLGAFAHKDMPFVTLLDELRIQPAPGRNALYQVLFMYYDIEDQQPHAPGLQVERTLLDGGTSEFELMFGISKRLNELGGYLEYNTDLFAEGTIQWLSREYERLLEQVAENPEVFPGMASADAPSGDRPARC